ncbi:aromatic ring-hydroxylating oxygenase subunit alpha [Acidisoma cladoniae]|jgi:Rieske 2Fe-2S family protein|uniref:aromatic ring-hydroxylating oxygenase subunit alpha n=1 Tax=Acidisoma cladoniae TaxID=3040935 RepID=UPI00254D458C|nr:aromatic ring-hydroxylating dioxygenase subunit alpha [Acidisoma sp. PAMC 29798]
MPDYAQPEPRREAGSYARIRAALDARLPGHSLPQSLYQDEEAFAFDQVAIFRRAWILIGFEIEFPATGSYQSLNVGGAPIIVIRDRTGVLRGFHNTCRHRGAELCPEGSGKSARLVCPYHQWTYDLSGKLIFAGRMGDDFDPAAHSLRPVHVETVAGTVYVCLADTAPDFEPYRAAVGPMLEPHDLKNAKIAFQNTLMEKANWKLVMENGRECYHCAGRHPELAVTFPIYAKGNFETVSDHEANFERRMTELGLPGIPQEAAWWQAARFPLNEGAVSMTMDGTRGVSKLMVQAGEGDIGSLRWAIEPHSFCHSTGDFTFMFSCVPISAHETMVIGKWLVHKDAVEGVDYDLERLIELWNTTNMQDRDLCELNQRGVNSPGYLPGPYSQVAESLVARFTNYYCNTAREYLDERDGKAAVAASAFAA